MRLLENPLNLMKEENDKSFLNIKSEDVRNEVKKLTDYISISSISAYQAEMVRKDLIGMAMEAVQENLSFAEKLGREPMEFCDDIVSSVGKPSLYEKVLRNALDIFKFSALYFTFGFFCFWGMPKQWRISLTDVAICLVFSVIGITALKLLNRRFAFGKNKWMKGIPILFFVLLAVGAYLARQSGIQTIYLIRGNGWLIVIVIDLLAAGLTLLWNQYWNRKMTLLKGILKK